MAIERLAGRAELVPRLLQLPSRLYAADRRWIPPDGAHLQQLLQAATRRAVDGRTSASEHFLGCTRGRIAARVSAFVNDALVDADGTRIGALGFFESEDDPALSDDLLSHAREWLREVHGISRVWGPINFDIWHGYRCMTAGFDAEPFAGEPYNAAYYPELLERSRGVPCYCWNSFEAAGSEPALAAYRRGTVQRDKALAEGYRFVQFDADRLEDELRKLHALISRAFTRFPAFTPIAARDFCQLSRPLAAALLPGGAWFLHDPADVCCGFAVALLDRSSELRTARRRNALACALRTAAAPASRRVQFHLIGVTPEAAVRSPGLGRALVTQVLGALVGGGYQRYLAPLILRGNVSRGLICRSPGAITRQYSLYEWRS
jgi:hypothetical protein